MLSLLLRLWPCLNVTIRHIRNCGILLCCSKLLILIFQNFTFQVFTVHIILKLTPSPLHFWRCITSITKSCLMNHSCCIDHRNHTLKCSPYTKESHHILRFVISLTTKLLLNLKPDKID